MFFKDPDGYTWEVMALFKTEYCAEFSIIDMKETGTFLDQEVLFFNFRSALL